MGRGPTKEYYNNFNENFVQNSLTNLKPEVIKSRITTDFPLILKQCTGSKLDFPLILKRSTGSKLDFPWVLKQRTVSKLDFPWF